MPQKVCLQNLNFSGFANNMFMSYESPCIQKIHEYFCNGF